MRRGTKAMRPWDWAFPPSPVSHREVVSAQADGRVFANGRWSFRADNTELHTLHHLGAGLFALPTQTVQAQPLPIPLS